jgi:hypothetical protein
MWVFVGKSGKHDGLAFFGLFHFLAAVFHLLNGLCDVFYFHQVFSLEWIWFFCVLINVVVDSKQPVQQSSK